LVTQSVNSISSVFFRSASIPVIATVSTPGNASSSKTFPHFSNLIMISKLLAL